MGHQVKRIKKSEAPPVPPKATATVAARPAPIKRNDFVYTYLRLGDVVELQGGEYVVEYINECRARVIPLHRKQVNYETVEGKKVEFEADASAKNISPNSDIPILRRLGPNWREAEKARRG